MKEVLDDATRKALVAYRMERAAQALAEADVMRRENFYNAAINRLYYACYYAASALLLAHAITVTTHNGLKTQLGLHFFRTGKLDMAHNTTFGLLFDKRHSSDYDDFVSCDADLVDMLRPRAEAFIQAIRNLSLF